MSHCIRQGLIPYTVTTMDHAMWYAQSMSNLQAPGRVRVGQPPFEMRCARRQMLVEVTKAMICTVEMALMLTT